VGAKWRARNGGRESAHCATRGCSPHCLAALGIFYGILNPLEGVMEQIRRALSKTITIQMPGNAANCFGLYCLRKFALQVIVLVHRLLSQRSDF
jgi:hypothetical protein